MVEFSISLELDWVVYRADSMIGSGLLIRPSCNTNTFTFNIHIQKFELLNDEPNYESPPFKRSESRNLG